MKHFIILTLLLFTIQVSAQDFKHSAGLRAGVSGGVTYRAYLNPELAYEALMSFRGSGLQITLLRQHFEPALWKINDGFFVTYGYGGHLGFTNSYTYKRLYKTVHYPDKKFSPLIGLDAFLGIEYHFPGMPVQVGIDYKPFFEFSLYQYFQMTPWDIAFTIKYKF